MTGPLKESDKSYLRRWAYEHTCEQVQGRIKLYREEATRMEYGIRLQAKLIAASSFLRYDHAIRRWMEGEPGDLRGGDDWERLPPTPLSAPDVSNPKGAAARPPPQAEREMPDGPAPAASQRGSVRPGRMSPGRWPSCGR